MLVLLPSVTTAGSWLVLQETSFLIVCELRHRMSYALSSHKTHWISLFLHQWLPNVRPGTNFKSHILADPKSLKSRGLALPVSRHSHDTELRAVMWESHSVKHMLMPEDCRVTRIILARMIPASCTGLKNKMCKDSLTGVRAIVCVSAPDARAGS